MMLKVTDQFTYLGIEIDNKFNFKPHVEKVRKKLKAICYNFYNLQHYTSMKTLKMVYHNLVESNVLYGLQVWGSSSQSNLLPIKQTLEGILKILTPKKRRRENVFDVLDVLSLDELYFYHFVINNYFKPKQENPAVSQNSLRPRDTFPLIIPPFNNKHGQRTQLYLTQSIFSKIPKSYLSETSYNGAKKKIHEWIRQNRAL
jgi:hypothetical protein